MRAVTKGGGHYQLNKRHAQYLQDIATGTATTPTNAWDNFNGKETTRHACWHEQLGLCAYSEIVLDDQDLGMHIDHVEPKSRNPSRTFDHGNLLLSAISSDRLQGMPKHEVFGGHLRGNRYSRTGFINPLWPDSRRYFHYAGNGEVEPALGLSASDVRKARYTIALLNLNSPMLVTRRRTWLQELELEIAKLLDAPDALRQFAEVELCETNGRLRPFHSAVRVRFGGMGEAVMARHCPACA
jgi:uncharacterized protein (TIGR02646 family)